MNRQDIQNVRLGAKQIPLEFEKDPTEEQDFVDACIRKYAQQHGEIVLQEFVQHVKKQHGAIGDDILQHVFWLAEDQKIGLRANGRNLSPYLARKALLESPDMEVVIIFHQPVSADVREHVQRFHAQMAGEPQPVSCADPHELSRLLAKQIRYWQDCLNFCRHGVEKKHFPGKKAMADALFLVDKISCRLDPFSLIHAFYENEEEILKLSEGVKTLYGFYLRHEKTWAVLIRAAAAFDDHEAQLNQIPGVAQDLRKLRQILASEEPYDRVEESKQCVESIRPHLFQVIEEKTASRRTRTISDIDRLIAELSETKGLNKEVIKLRRQALQNLRSIAKQIPLASNIRAIDRLSGEAHDLHEEAMEEIHSLCRQ